MPSPRGRRSGNSVSARSLIYADGYLLATLIGNNNSGASPRRALVAQGEIGRIDVMYGPFSAAYPGSSMGAVVEITTRMPQTFDGGAGGIEHGVVGPIALAVRISRTEHYLGGCGSLNHLRQQTLCVQRRIPSRAML